MSASPSPLPMPVRHLALLLLINVIWAFNIVPVKLALEHIPPLTAGLLRFAIVLAVCATHLRWMPGQMRPLIAVALCHGVAMFGLMNLAFARAEDVAGLAIASQLGVPFSLLLAMIFLRERIDLRRGLGVGLAFLGVVYMSFDPQIFSSTMALALGVGSSFFWALGALFMRHLRDVPLLTLQAWVALVSVPLLLVMVMVFEPQGLIILPDIALRDLGYLLFSALLSSIVAHSGMAWLLQRYPVTVISPLTLLTPLLSVGFSVLLLHNVVTDKMLIGGGVALLGVALIVVRGWRRREAV